MLMQSYLTSKCKNFLRKKAAKVSLKTVKATTTQPQVMNPRVSISDVYTSRMAAWIVLISFILFIILFGVAIKEVV